MVLAKREAGLEIGATVRCKSGRIVGSVFEVSERCFGVLLEGTLPIWLGRQTIECVQGGSIVLISNLLRKTATRHDGLARTHPLAPKTHGTTDSRITYQIRFRKVIAA